MSVSDSSGLGYFTVGLLEVIHHLNNNRQEEVLDEFLFREFISFIILDRIRVTERQNIAL